VNLFDSEAILRQRAQDQSTAFCTKIASDVVMLTQEVESLRRYYQRIFK